MTVAQLISRLRTMPQEAEVYRHNDEFGAAMIVAEVNHGVWPSFFDEAPPKTGVKIK